MKSIIEDLFFGKIYPYDQLSPTQDNYEEKEKRLMEKEDNLESQLTAEQRKLFNEILSLKEEIDSIETMQSFKDGFKLGSKLIVEALSK